MVYVDGVAVGSPSYNHYRSDVATLFPGLANSGGPVGFKIIDTTTLSNGLHTIVWTATDNLGVTSGLGSRFFRVSNGAMGPDRRDTRRDACECRSGDESCAACRSRPRRSSGAEAGTRRHRGESMTADARAGSSCAAKSSIASSSRSASIPVTPTPGICAWESACARFRSGLVWIRRPVRLRGRQAWDSWAPTI